MSVRLLDAGTLELGGGLEILVAAVLEGLAPGGEVDVVLASRAAALELPAWARINGHAVSGERSERDAGDARWVVRVRRGAGARVLGGDLPPPRAPLAGERPLRMEDVRGAIGPPPAHVDPRGGLVPLRAIAEPGGPAHDWGLNERDAIWATEIATLTERAAADGWDATADIPWSAAAGLPADVERAVAQVMTYIAQTSTPRSTSRHASCRRSTRSTPRS